MKKSTRNRWNKQKRTNNLVDLDPILSLVMLNVNSLKYPIKKAEIVRLDEKPKPNIFI